MPDENVQSDSEDSEESELRVQWLQTITDQLNQALSNLKFPTAQEIASELRNLLNENPEGQKEVETEVIQQPSLTKAEIETIIHDILKQKAEVTPAESSQPKRNPFLYKIRKPG